MSTIVKIEAVVHEVVERKYWVYVDPEVIPPAWEEMDEEQRWNYVSVSPGWTDTDDGRVVGEYNTQRVYIAMVEEE